LAGYFGSELDFGGGECVGVKKEKFVVFELVSKVL